MYLSFLSQLFEELHFHLEFFVAFVIFPTIQRSMAGRREEIEEREEGAEESGERIHVSKIRVIGEGRTGDNSRESR